MIGDPERIQTCQMDDEADGPERQAEQPGKARRRGQRHPPNAQGVCKAAPRYGKAADARRRHDDEGRGRDEPRLHGGRADDKAADDGKALPHGLRQRDACLLQQLKGGQQPEHLHDGRERHSALAL